MIRKYKNLEELPVSLRTDDESIKVNPARTTNERRLELIDAGRYIDEEKFNQRYKTADVKAKLNAIYPTCCFCGYPDQQLEVEHYRPKSHYHWLAYSWDNLLYACTKCNKAKKAYFDIAGTKVEPKTDKDVTDINRLSEAYDLIEKPMLINPEKVTDEELAAFLYHKNGHVTSEHPRVKYTIEKCDLDRKNLVETRKSIWDDFVAQFNDRILTYQAQPDMRQAAIESLIRDFIAKSIDESSMCVAFRRHAIKSGWLQSMSD